MTWFCQCGNGSLCGDPPEHCGLCGFPLWEYFDAQGGDDDDDE
jgi:hypothetical protein